MTRSSTTALREPRWPPAVTVLAAVALHFALPSSLRVGPPWLGAAGVLALVLLSAYALHAGYTRLNQRRGYAIAAALTIGLVAGVIRLLLALTERRESAAVILRSASVLWAANVITFAVWYWRLDAGGPNERAQESGPVVGAFLFPQLALAEQSPAGVVVEAWRPHFVDYLFLSFNTSTAFSPTDVPVLGRWAKLLTMVQAMISFTTVVVIVARSINIL